MERWDKEGNQPAGWNGNNLEFIREQLKDELTREIALWNALLWQQQLLHASWLTLYHSDPLVRKAVIRMVQDRN